MLRRAAALALILAAATVPGTREAAARSSAQPPAPAARTAATTASRPAPPASAPAQARAESLAALPNGMPRPGEFSSYWFTRAERTGYRLTAGYDETVAYLRRLEAASNRIHVESYGRSGQGRDLVLVVAARDRAFTPEAARATGRPIVLVQCGIHSGEIEGKDACLALLRDLCITGRQDALLDHCILLVVPMFSPDSHERQSRYNRINQNGPEEMGWRTTPIGLNLNRDYLKAEAPEMQQFLARVFTRWWPHLLVDTHTTDGADYRYDVTYSFSRGPDIPPDVARWLVEAIEGRVAPALERMGHLPAPYISFRHWEDPISGIDWGDAPPRFSSGYPPTQCRPGLLVETHMLKPYETRVRATYDLLAALLAEINARPGLLTGAVAAAEEQVVARGRERDAARRQVVLSARATRDSVLFPYRGYRYRREMSDILGAPVTRWEPTPLDTLLPFFPTLEPALTVTQPVGYLVPREWTRVIERLDTHGVRYRRFAQAWSDTVEQEKVVDWKAAGEPHEGHFAISVNRIETVRRWRAWRPGDLWVPLDQRSAQVAVHLFEAQGPDALVRWNFFDTVLEYKEYGEMYVIEPMARRMLQEDPGLAAEFRSRVASDPAFAANPFARADFFYRRSPWADPEQNLLPVARALRPPPESALEK